MKNTKSKFISLKFLVTLSLLFLSLVSSSFSNHSFYYNSYNKSVQDDNSGTVNISNISLGAFYKTSSGNGLPITYENQNNKGLFFESINAGNNLYLYFLLTIDFNKSDITSKTNIITVTLNLNSNLNKNQYQSYWIPNENKINELFTNQINTILSANPFAPNQSFSILNLNIKFTYTSSSDYAINLGDYKITNNYLDDLNKSKGENNDTNDKLKKLIDENDQLNTVKIILVVFIVVLIIMILIFTCIIIKNQRRMKN